MYTSGTSNCKSRTSKMSPNQPRKRGSRRSEGIRFVSTRLDSEKAGATAGACATIYDSGDTDKSQRPGKREDPCQTCPTGYYRVHACETLPIVPKDCQYRGPRSSNSSKWYFDSQYVQLILSLRKREEKDFTDWKIQAKRNRTRNRPRCCF